ncbi:UNVERIFIED_CONTAM: hypothetical protein K2H54_019806 [Gekko kuhli]
MVLELLHLVDDICLLDVFSSGPDFFQDFKGSSDLSPMKELKWTESRAILGYLPVPEEQVLQTLIPIVRMLECTVKTGDYLFSEEECPALLGCS